MVEYLDFLWREFSFLQIANSFGERRSHSVRTFEIALAAVARDEDVFRDFEAFLSRIT